RWLETLTAVHSYVYDDGSWPEVRAEHPAITTHPETGAKVLYVNRSYTSHIKELEPAESRSLLAFLYRLTEQPRFQCRFRRSANALAFWDNRAAQHMALWDYRPAVRSGHRVDIGQAQ
ncbi:MAG: taurine dioxygenase, partial [Rhodospirillaceae bacterium]|nr:taurine dioxygenase [Rhodospirillaceae bacterium]